MIAYPLLAKICHTELNAEKDAGGVKSRSIAVAVVKSFAS
jgi:hypothetical protein